MSDKPKQKRYYSVRIEGIVPITVEYRILAEDENQAFEIVEKNPLAQLAGPVKPDLRRMKKIKASIKDTLTGFINWTKRF